MNFRNLATIASAAFFRRIFGGGKNFGGSKYSAAARKSKPNQSSQWHRSLILYHTADSTEAVRIAILLNALARVLAGS